MFYDGWLASSGISINTPERAPAGVTDEKSDDISHAGISIKFIQEYTKLFPDVFSIEDLAKLSKTADNLSLGNKFPRNITGLGNGETALFRNIPTYGWSDYFVVFQQYYKNILPSLYPFFDSVTSYVYPLTKGSTRASFKYFIIDINGNVILTQGK